MPQVTHGCLLVINHQKPVLPNLPNTSSWARSRDGFPVRARFVHLSYGLFWFDHLHQHNQATGVISHWFKFKRAYAVGIVISGSSLGGVIFPIMLNRLILQIGFASAVRATAYVILGCLTIANLTIRPRLPAMKDRPVEMQLPKPDIKKILRHPAYLFALAGGFFVVWGMFLPFFYLQSEH